MHPGVLPSTIGRPLDAVVNGLHARLAVDAKRDTRCSEQGRLEHCPCLSPWDVGDPRGRDASGDSRDRAVVGDRHEGPPVHRQTASEAVQPGSIGVDLPGEDAVGRSQHPLERLFGGSGGQDHRSLRHEAPVAHRVGALRGNGSRDDAVVDTLEPLGGRVLAYPGPVVKIADLALLEDVIRWNNTLLVKAGLVHEVVHADQAPVMLGEACGEASALRPLPSGGSRLERTAVVVVPLVTLFFGPQELVDGSHLGSHTEVAE